MQSSWAKDPEEEEVINAHSSTKMGGPEKMSWEIDHQLRALGFKPRAARIQCKDPGQVIHLSEVHVLLLRSDGIRLKVLGGQTRPADPGGLSPEDGKGWAWLTTDCCPTESIRVSCVAVRVSVSALGHCGQEGISVKSTFSFWPSHPTVSSLIGPYPAVNKGDSKRGLWGWDLARNSSPSSNMFRESLWFHALRVCFCFVFTGLRSREILSLLFHCLI